MQRTIQCSAVQRTGFVHSNPLYFTSVHSFALPSLGGRNPSSHHCVTFSDLWISSFSQSFGKLVMGRKEYIQLWSSFENKSLPPSWLLSPLRYMDLDLEVTAEAIDDSCYSYLVVLFMLMLQKKNISSIWHTTKSFYLKAMFRKFVELFVFCRILIHFCHSARAS